MHYGVLCLGQYRDNIRRDGFGERIFRESLFEKNNTVVTSRHLVVQVDEESERLCTLVVNVYVILMVVIRIGIFHRLEAYHDVFQVQVLGIVLKNERKHERPLGVNLWKFRFDLFKYCHVGGGRIHSYDVYITIAYVHLHTIAVRDALRVSSNGMAKRFPFVSGALAEHQTDISRSVGNRIGNGLGRIADNESHFISRATVGISADILVFRLQYGKNLIVALQNSGNLPRKGRHVVVLHRTAKGELVAEVAARHHR